MDEAVEVAVGVAVKVGWRVMPIVKVVVVVEAACGVWQKRPGKMRAGVRGRRGRHTTVPHLIFQG